MTAANENKRVLAGETDAPADKKNRCIVTDPLARRRGDKPLLIFDGGLATHMQSLGVDVDHSLWAAKCLETDHASIKKAHGDFFAAGADVAITASYQAHFKGFAELGVDEEGSIEAMKRSVRLAREAAPSDGLVAGSCGAYGASLANGAEYTGDYPGMDEEKLLEWHKPRARALVEAGADVLAFETVPCLMEGKALAKLSEELQHPMYVTFSCASGTEVNSKELFADCVEALASSNFVVGVGVNCTNPKFVADLVTIAKKILPPNKNIIVYPNSGEAYCGITHSWVSGTAASDDDFVKMAREWNRLGANCIGGCCRTTPNTIKALRSAFPGEGAKA